MRFLRKLLFIAPALALLGTFLLVAPGAGAQEREPVDLELSMVNRFVENNRGGTFVVSVKNNSPVTVRNIRVQLEVDELTEGRTIFLLEHAPGDNSLYRNDGFVNSDILEWVIPELRGGLTAITRLTTDNAKSPQTLPDQTFMLRLRGSIVASSPPEAPARLGNNQARTHLLYTNVSGGTRARIILLTSIKYGVDADPGANTFTVKVANRNITIIPWTHQTAFQYQVRVRVTPSPGLDYTAMPPSGTSFNRATGIWDIGTLNINTVPEGNRSLEIQVKGRNALAVPEEEQCLTVEIEHIIPDLEEPHLPVTACMDHKALITQGLFDIFNWHDCTSETDYPCDSQPSLELVATKPAYGIGFGGRPNVGAYAVGDVHRGRFRSDLFGPGHSTNSMVLQPEEVVVQVPDNVATRVTDSGNTVWSTVDLFNLYIYQDKTSFDSSWSDLKESVTVSGVDGAAFPGRWRMRGNTFDFLDATDSMKVVGTAYQPSAIPSDNDTSFRIEFGALGTYVALFEIEATKSGTTYTDSATYTFHVGPVAELEVRDEPAHSLAEPGQRAYTVVARNQGPDTAPAVRVRLTGVPRDAEALTSRGSYAQGDCDANGLCEGVWTIGEMLDAESRFAQGRTEGEVLTIIPPAGGGPITAVIENTRDYSVVIDGTTHSTNYYDYLDHNNEAEIALRPAPSAGPPGRPERPSVARLPPMAWLPAFALVQWQPMEYLNGFRVSHYEVQRSSSLWETVADDVGGTVYLDMGDGSASAAYRVRAVNEAGGHGPWSLSSAPGTGTLGAPTGLTATPGLGDASRIDLSWFAPSGETGLSYHIEYAFDGAGPWTRLRTQSGTTYSHTGLISGATYYYRVAAVKGSIISPWAYVQATAEGPEVYAPGWPMNLRFTSVERTAVTLAWDPPADDGGSPVTGYEYRAFGPCSSGSGTCDIVAPTRVGGTTTSRRISLPDREGTYEFQVRALNAVGAGDWSQSITKEVGPQTAVGGRVILSPSRLTVTEGGQATYRVKLSTNPAMPLWVVLHWYGDGDENLGGELPFQQLKILLPGGYDTSGLPEWCGGVRLDWNEAYAWNTGVPITVVAAEDDDSENETLTILHDIWTVPHDCLGMAEEDWQPDPVYEGMLGPALEVSGRDND